MTKDNPKIKSVLKSLFLTSVEKFVKENASLIGYLYVQFDAETGEVQVYDEQEHLLHKKVIFDWVGVDGKQPHFVSKMLSLFKQVIDSITADGVFANPCFAKPFSVCLTDEEYKVIAEIATIDDEETTSEEVLMKNLDKELNEFLKKLLSDVE